MEDYEFTSHPTCLPFDQPVDLDRLSCDPKIDRSNKAWKAQLTQHVAELKQRQRVLYARDSHAILCIFQGMDASGKDSTIRAVFSGVNPAGCRVTSFKSPSTQELEHDFLWRGLKAAPARGMIGVHNRSWYEDVLVVRVHPELLGRHLLKGRKPHMGIWEKRYRSIRNTERHLADNGTVILKFFLHLSKDEQRRRLVRRLQRPDKHWKFDPADLKERARWADYQRFYEEALNETSRPWAPWYAIPADHKPSMREAVARVVRHTLERLDLRWPAPPDPAVLDNARQQLLNES